jgi:hypothetical protein
MLSNAICAVSLAAMGLYFFWKEHVKHYGQDFVDSLNWLPTVACVTFIVGFSLALGPVVWLMMGELFPVKFRGVASGIATMVNWGAAFLVTKSFTALQDAVGLSGSFWIYAGCALVGGVFVIFFVPETKGKSPSEIAAYFGAHMPVS